MTLKAGDKVKTNRGLAGIVTAIINSNKWPFCVKFSDGSYTVFSADELTLAVDNGLDRAIRKV